MNLFSFISLFFLLLSLYFAIESIKDNYKSPVNKSYALLLAVYSMWCLAAALMHSSYLKLMAIFWYKVCVVIASFSLLAFLIFIIFLTGFKPLVRKWFIALISLPTIIISSIIIRTDFIMDAVKLPDTWFIVLNTKNIWNHLFFGHQFLCAIFSAILLFIAIKRTNSVRQKKLLRMIAMTLVIPTFFIFISVIMSYMQQVNIFQNTYHLVAFTMFIGIEVAITRFGLMKLTPNIALKNILMNINDFVILLNRNGQIVEVNDELVSILKIKKEKLSTGNIEMILNSRRISLDDLISKINLNKTISTEVEIINKYNEKIPVNIYATILIDKFNEINGYLIVGHDIRQSQLLEIEQTERRVTENSLIESALQYKSTIDAMSDFIHVIDKNYMITLCNKSLMDFAYKVGKDRYSIIGQNLFSVIHELGEKNRKEYEKVFEQGEMIISEHELIFPGITIMTETRKIPVIENNKVNKIVTIIRDITLEKKNEEHIMRSARLDSLGILAGGIAHDFNNMLTGILGNINLAKNLIDKNNPIKNLLIESEKASFKAKDLTYQLLTFSKGGEPVKKPGSIVELIREAAEFILRGSNIEVSYKIADDILFVEFDQGQMVSVFHNLIINAREAMNKKAGKMNLHIENYESFENNMFNIPKGRFVKISISDNGPGIKKEIVQKIFDPYFTTKEKGNGLGLAIAFSIIKRHGGFIDVASDTNKGTTFYIYLPATNKIIKHSLVSQTENIPLSYDILMMDDDEMIRKISKKLLTYLGCNVTFALDGSEAIQKYQKSLETNNPFDIVILDLTIKGGMGGKETIEHLLTMNKDINAIVCSGYSNDPVLSEYKKHGFKGVISKPFDMQDLKKEIINVMEHKN